MKIKEPSLSNSKLLSVLQSVDEESVADSRSEEVFRNG
jgi:hypothetical protein